jgi:hypothetical protein
MTRNWRGNRNRSRDIGTDKGSPDVHREGASTEPPHCCVNQWGRISDHHRVVRNGTMVALNIRWPGIDPPKPPPDAV